MFHDHVINDTVRVVAGNQAYMDTHTNFAADHGATVPDLPAGVIERIYEPGIRHAISDGSSVIDAGPMPWAFGDTAIGNIALLLAAQAKRTQPATKRTSQPYGNHRSGGTATMAS